MRFQEYKGHHYNTYKQFNLQISFASIFFGHPLCMKKMIVKIYEKLKKNSLSQMDTFISKILSSARRLIPRLVQSHVTKRGLILSIVAYPRDFK